MEWTLKPFSALTAAELFEIYKNRVDVFVVEQNCPYHEVDDRDLTAQHLFVKQDGRLPAMTCHVRRGESHGERFKMPATLDAVTRAHH